MKTKYISTLLALALIAIGRMQAEPTSEPVKTVAISAYDTMKFSLTQIEVHPGQKLRVQLTNEGNLPKEVMGHNWVLLKAGLDPVAYSSAAIAAKAEGYQPMALADEVLASIPLLGSKETGEVTFTAPTVPGNYSFLCSSPAHCQVGMRGVLIVK
jgi:azurin